MNNEVYNVNEVYIDACDIGKLNFCFCVEKFNPCPLGCKLPPKKLRYIAKRPVTFNGAQGALSACQFVVIRGKKKGSVCGKVRCPTKGHRGAGEAGGAIEAIEAGKAGKVNEFDSNGECTPEFAAILNNVCSEGEVVLHKNIDITGGEKTNGDHILVNMYKVLEEHSEYFDKCAIIIIESQMAFGKNTNVMALKLAQHCKSYFIFKYASGEKEIIDFPAYHKTKVFGAGKMTKPQRKKWAPDKAVDILLGRGDIQGAELINSARKKDDLADTLVELQAFKFLRYVSEDI